jgi:hypothetical protein
MSNVLKVSQQTTIYSLADRGWSQRRIARELRIHGTTCKQVSACFEEERPDLQPLPASLFPCFQEGRRTVHRDSYVGVEKAFYETPPEYIGREVWVRSR